MTEPQPSGTVRTEDGRTRTLSKRLVVGSQQWGIADANAEEVATHVKDAMANGTRVLLEVCDPDTEHPVLVYLNGVAADSVEVDMLRGPRPSEMS